MPRTIGHISDMHRIRTERVNAGLPVWKGTLRIKQHLTGDDDFDGEEFRAARDAIVAAIRKHSWYTGKDAFGELHEVVRDLADSDDSDTFDYWLDELYDLADYDRIWIG